MSKFSFNSKTFLLATLGIFIIFGVCLIGLGSASLIRSKGLKSNGTNEDILKHVLLPKWPIPTILVGSALLIASMLGCYGIIRESSLLLIIFVICTAILNYGSLMCGYFIFGNLYNLAGNGTVVTKWLNSTLYLQLHNSTLLLTRVQPMSECCGNIGIELRHIDSSTNEYACCVPEVAECTSKGTYPRCPDNVTDYFQTSLHLQTLAGTIGGIFTLATIIGVLASTTAVWFLNHRHTNEEPVEGSSQCTSSDFKGLNASDTIENHD